MQVVVIVKDEFDVPLAVVRQWSKIEAVKIPRCYTSPFYVPSASLERSQNGHVTLSLLRFALVHRYSVENPNSASRFNDVHV